MTNKSNRGSSSSSIRKESILSYTNKELRNYSSTISAVKYVYLSRSVIYDVCCKIKCVWKP